jgi:hypothetical protein
VGWKFHGGIYEMFEGEFNELKCWLDWLKLFKVIIKSFQKLIELF